MAKLDRCELCDYTESEGSLLANVAPYAHGKVRYNHSAGQMLCQMCEGVIIDTLMDFVEEDDWLSPICLAPVASRVTRIRNTTTTGSATDSAEAVGSILETEEK